MAPYDVASNVGQALVGGGEPLPVEPKLVVGNLATDVAPEVVERVLVEYCEGLDLGGAGDLVGVFMAVFGPARPITKRDRGRQHRGFALVVGTTHIDSPARHVIRWRLTQEKGAYSGV